MDNRFGRALAVFSLVAALALLASCGGSPSNRITGNPTLVSITVTSTSSSVVAGSTVQFTATGKFSDGSTSNITSSVTWASSNTTAATINSAGLAKGVTAGQSTNISATQGGVSGSTSLSVTAATLVSITVTSTSSSVVVGSTLQFTATGKFSDGSTSNITSSVTWASSNTTAATINSAGLAKGVTAGQSTNISATQGGISGSTSLSVIAATLVSITVTSTSSSVVAGSTVQFTATGKFSDGSTSNITSSVTWASSNTTAATINSAGLAKGVTAGQSTNISATQGGVSGSTSLSVTAATVVSVSISPKRAGLTVTQGLSVTATTNDTAGVKWTATAGGFSSSTSLSGIAVTYTAPSSAGSYTITATSATDMTTSTSLPVYVTDLAGVYTYHNDLARDGANTQEYALTTSSVSTSTFGKLFSCTVDGAIYAQPLWVANLTINSAKHNVVFVATQHDSLYAFDADANPCVQLWHVSLLGSGEVTVPSGTSGFLVGSGNGDITPEVGVTGTPVIDPSTNTLYVVSKSMNSGGTSFFQRLHAIDIMTGSEKFSGPANITNSITFPGTGDGGTTVSFNARQQNQRAGLALVNGFVYVAWASHEDHAPYYGWVVGFKASNLAVTYVLNVSPNVHYGGIWMGGGAPSADNNNNLYLITGNATFDVTNTTGPTNDYGDSFLRLSPSLTISPAPPSTAAYFTPSDQANDNANDQDFGAGGSAVVLNLTSGSPSHLVIGGGKDGALYLLNGDAMGGLGDSHAWQPPFNIGYGIFATGAFWNNTYYIAGIHGPLLSYSFNSSTKMFSTTIASQSSTSYGFPGATPSVSSTGSSNGIVWALNNGSYCTTQSSGCGPTVLHAYDATTLTSDLWNSSASSDAAGNAVKFTVPTVANGKVYVGTRGNNTGGAFGSTSVSGELDVYGLKPD